MNIAVIGLGIIGGSFCKAIKKYTDHYVIGLNRTAETAEKALSVGAIDEIGTYESLSKADLVILTMYPQADIDFIKENGSYIKKGAIVTDASGIKCTLCPELKELSQKFGFIFVGSHPMAGKEKNGFDVSDAELYQNASFIITPCEAEQKYVVNRLRHNQNHDSRRTRPYDCVYFTASARSCVCVCSEPLLSESQGIFSRKLP